jgi:hypothetical protein
MPRDHLYRKPSSRFHNSEATDGIPDCAPLSGFAPPSPKQIEYTS